MRRINRNGLNYLAVLLPSCMSVLLSVQGSAEAQMRCSFNGNWEDCTVIKQKDTEKPYTASRTVRWLTDGKVVTYKFADCRKTEHPWAWKCNAMITEDNGRVTLGNAILTSGGKTTVTSRNGNTTIIPMFNMK